MIKAWALLMFNELFLGPLSTFLKISLKPIHNFSSYFATKQKDS